MLVKPDLLLLNLIAKLESTNSKENKDISATLMPLDFTNASEMLIAQAMLPHDLNSFLALKELNADAETLIKNALPWDTSPHALIPLTINHTPLEPPPEPLELLDTLLTQLTNLLINKTFAETTDGIASTFLKDTPLTSALIPLAETLEMVVFVPGMLIPTLDLVSEILIALDSDNAMFHLTAETSMPMLVSSTHVVVSEEFASQFALHKLMLKSMSPSTFDSPFERL